MARKEYTCNLKSMSIIVNVGDKKVRVTFGNGYNVGRFIRYGKFATSDKELQKALESDSRFGYRYKLTDTTGAEEEPVVEPVKAEKPVENAAVEQETVENKIYEEVKTVRDAMTLLAGEPYNLKAVQCNTKAKIEKKCKEFGISFPNIVYDL